MTVVLVLACLGYPVLIGAVILMDRIMAGTNYKRAVEPLVVSSILGPVWVIPVCLFMDGRPISWQAAALGIAAGIILTVCNWSYFQCMFYRKGRLLFVLGGLEASRPISVAIVMQALPLLGLLLTDDLGYRRWLGILIAAVGLILVKCWGEHQEGDSAVPDNGDSDGADEYDDAAESVLPGLREKIGIAAAMIVFFVLAGVYTIVYKQACLWAKASIDLGGDDLNEWQVGVSVWRSVLPYFWLGAGISGGALPFLFPGSRRELFKAAPRIGAAWKLIALMELIAALGFCCELFALERLHPGLVALVSASTGLVVLVGGLLLRQRSEYRKSIPPVGSPWKKGVSLAVVVLGVFFVVA